METPMGVTCVNKAETDVSVHQQQFKNIVLKHLISLNIFQQ